MGFKVTELLLAGCSDVCFKLQLRVPETASFLKSEFIDLGSRKLKGLNYINMKGQAPKLSWILYNLILDMGLFQTK